MDIKQGIIKSFDSGTYTATVQVSGVNPVYLEGITVARNIAAAQITVGRKAALLFYEEQSAAGAVVIGVYE